MVCPCRGPNAQPKVGGGRKEDGTLWRGQRPMPFFGQAKSTHDRLPCSQGLGNQGAQRFSVLWQISCGIDEQTPVHKQGAENFLVRCETGHDDRCGAGEEAPGWTRAAWEPLDVHGMHGRMGHDGHQCSEFVEAVGLSLVAYVIRFGFRRGQTSSGHRAKDQAFVVLGHPTDASASTHQPVPCWSTTASNPRGHHAVLKREQAVDVNGFLNLCTWGHREHQATSSWIRPINGRCRSTAYLQRPNWPEVPSR